MPRLEIRGGPDPLALGTWQDALTKTFNRKIYHLFLNPGFNEYLARLSAVEILCDVINQTEPDNFEQLTKTTAFKLVKRIAVESADHSWRHMQFRVVVVGPGSFAEEEDVALQVPPWECRQ